MTAALAWLYLLGAVSSGLVALREAWRARRRIGPAFVVLAGLVVVAAITRAAAHYGPSNWQVDWFGPDGAAPTDVRRAAGLVALFQQLGRFGGFDSNFVFALCAFASASGLLLLVRAAQNSEEKERLPDGLALGWGLLLLTDASLVYVGTSEAPHNFGILAFGLCAWWWWRAHDALSLAGRVTASLGVAGAAAMTGISRPELTLFPLALPFLLAWGAIGRRWLGASLPLTAGVAAAALYWLAHPLAATVVYPGIEQLLPWLNVSLPHRVHLPGYALLGLAPLVLLATSVKHRTWQPLAAIAVFTATMLPRLWHDAMRFVPVAGSYAFVRYEVLTIALWLFLAAYALACVPQLLGVRVQRRALASTVVLLGWLLTRAAPATFRDETLPDTQGFPPRVASAVEPTRFVRQAGDWFPEVPLSFRRDYDFLATNLRELPQGARVLTVWTDHFRPGCGRDIDVGLSPLNALLAFDRPDLRWIVLRTCEDAKAARLEAGDFLFLGSFAEIDTSEATMQRVAGARRLPPDETICFAAELRCLGGEAQRLAGGATPVATSEPRLTVTMLWPTRERRSGPSLWKESEPASP